MTTNITYLSTWLLPMNRCLLRLSWNPSFGIAAVLPLLTCLRQRHFLAGMLLHEIERSLAFSEEQEINAKVFFWNSRAHKIQSIESLRFILLKHEFDHRYKDTQKRETIAAIYFPFLTLVVDHITTIQKATLYEKKTWLICFLYVLKGRNKSFFSAVLTRLRRQPQTASRMVEKRNT